MLVALPGDYEIFKELADGMVVTDAYQAFSFYATGERGRVWKECVVDGKCMRAMGRKKLG